MHDLRGKMLAIEGIDGVGKSTATAAVAERLRGDGLDVRVHDFPVYDEPRFGPLIKAFLHGDLTIEGSRTAYAVATLFAGNRVATAPALAMERDAGATLVCDRYLLSNAAYQGARLPDAELDAFLAWVLDLESDALTPDASIWLRLPLHLRPHRARADDVYERDLALQQRVHDVYQRLADAGRVTPVECAPDGVLLAPEEIAERVVQIVAGAPNG